MPNFKLGLAQNLPNRPPAAFRVIYTYRNGTQQMWWVDHVHPDRDAAFITVTCAANLLQPDVASRSLKVYYPTQPDEVTLQILTVQPALVAHDMHTVSSQETLMSTAYAITLTMSDATINALRNGGYYFYAFKGVQSTMKGGAPTVWFQSQTYSQATKVAWQESYEAYSSLSALVPNGEIIATASYAIDLQQTFNIDSDAGTGTVVQGGTPGAISIHNLTNVQFTSGISQVIGGTASPLCAFPQYGGGLNVMAPIQKVLLMFATLPVDTGTVIYKAYSRGVLVDLTGVTQRSVSFDINTGWSWGGGSWAQQVAANADLVPLLIESSADLESRALTALAA